MIVGQKVQQAGCYTEVIDYVLRDGKLTAWSQVWDDTEIEMLDECCFPIYCDRPITTVLVRSWIDQEAL